MTQIPPRQMSVVAAEFLSSLSNTLEEEPLGMCALASKHLALYEFGELERTMLERLIKQKASGAQLIDEASLHCCAYLESACMRRLKDEMIKAFFLRLIDILFVYGTHTVPRDYALVIPEVFDMEAEIRRALRFAWAVRERCNGEVSFEERTALVPLVDYLTFLIPSLDFSVDLPRSQLKQIKDAFAPITALLEQQRLQEVYPGTKMSIDQLKLQLLNKEIALQSKILMAQQTPAAPTHSQLQESLRIIRSSLRASVLNSQIETPKSVEIRPEVLDGLRFTATELECFQRLAGVGARIRAVQQKAYEVQKLIKATIPGSGIRRWRQPCAYAFTASQAALRSASFFESVMQNARNIMDAFNGLLVPRKKAELLIQMVLLAETLSFLLKHVQLIADADDSLRLLRIAHAELKDCATDFDALEI